MKNYIKYLMISLLIFIPSFVLASGTAEQYFMISLIISIPSIIAMIVLFIFIVKKSKLTTKDSLKIWLISFVSLMVIGISFPGGDKFFPNWFVYMNNEFASPIITSFIGSFLLLITYVSKWNTLHQPQIEDVPSTEDENESNTNGNHMKEYQLVLQFCGDTEESFNEMIEIEELLEENLEKTSYIDGHDIGLNEMNIFIITNDAKSTFIEIKKLLPTKMSKIKCAFRKIGSDQYSVLWPFNLKYFKLS